MVGFFNRFISDISGVRRETTFSISYSIEIGRPVETETVRVVSLCTTEITEITRFKKIPDLQGPGTLNLNCRHSFKGSNSLCI